MANVKKSYPKVNFVFTEEVRMIGGSILEPWDDEKFTGKFLIQPNHADLKAMYTAAAKAASDAGTDTPLKDLYLCWRTTEEAAKAALEDDAEADVSIYSTPGIVLNAKTTFAPRVSVMAGETVTLLQGPQRLSVGKQKIYRGAYVLVDIAFTYYDKNKFTGKPGITAYLNEVCWVRDGERSGNETARTSSFKGRATAQAATTENPFS